jgi:hypothetical protein
MGKLSNLSGYLNQRGNAHFLPTKAFSRLPSRLPTRITPKGTKCCELGTKNDPSQARPQNKRKARKK